jgi:putative transcriptional regulator
MAMRRKRFGWLFAAALLPAALTGALPGAGDVPEQGSLTGQLLVATPEMRDPRFSHTVILMVRHGKEGAFGIIINRPIEERPIAALLDAMGQKDAKAQGKIRIFAGGPVEPSVGFVLHSTDYRRTETMAIDGRLAMTRSPEILHDIGHSAGPAKTLLAFGYAGWGPGQLEAELADHDWFTAPEDPKLVFDDDRDKLWTEAMARRTREL